MPQNVFFSTQWETSSSKVRSGAWRVKCKRTLWTSSPCMVPLCPCTPPLSCSPRVSNVIITPTRSMWFFWTFSWCVLTLTFSVHVTQGLAGEYCTERLTGTVCSSLVSPYEYCRKMSGLQYMSQSSYTLILSHRAFLSLGYFVLCNVSDQRFINVDKRQLYAAPITSN